MEFNKESTQLHYLTVLRAFAALWVAIHHTQSSLSGITFEAGGLAEKFFWRGWLGVDLFFILSGFIICHNYWGKLDLSIESFKKFWWKRIVRIYPSHFIILMGFVLVIEIARELGYFYDTQNTHTLGNLFSQIFMLHGIGFFQAAGWNFPSWSLSSELMAYLFVPLFFVVLKIFKNVFVLAFIIILKLLIGIFLAIFLNDSEKYMLDFEYSWFRILSEFFIGTLLSRIRMSLKQAPIYWIGALAALGAIVLQSYVRDSFYDFMYLIYFALLILSLSLIPRSKRIVVASTLGEISYSYYLMHIPVIIGMNQILKLSIFSLFTPLMTLIFFLFTTYIFAHIFFVMVERNSNLLASIPIRLFLVLKSKRPIKIKYVGLRNKLSNN